MVKNGQPVQKINVEPTENTALLNGGGNVNFTPPMSPFVQARASITKTPGDETKCTESEARAVFMNYMMGISFLVYPYVVRVSGVFGFLITFTYLAAVSFYTGLSLCDVLDDTDDIKNDTFGDLIINVLGNFWAVVVASLQYCELFFYVVAYIVMMGDNFCVIINSVFSTNFQFWESRLLWCILVLPTLFLKNAKALSALSDMAVKVTFLMLFLLLLGQFIHKETTPWKPVPATEINWWNYNEMWWGHATCMAGFSGHSVIPEIRGEMQRPRNFRKVFSQTYGLIIASFVITTYTAYATFGNAAETQLTFNYTGWIAVLIQLCIVFNGYSRVALTVYPISLFFQERFKELEKSNNSLFWTGTFTFRTIIMVFAFVASVILGSLDRVMTVVGIICAIFFVYIITLLLWNTVTGKTSSMGRKLINYVIILIAAFSIVMGLIQLMNFVDPTIPIAGTEVIDTMKLEV